MTVAATRTFRQQWGKPPQSKLRSGLGHGRAALVRILPADPIMSLLRALPAVTHAFHGTRACYSVAVRGSAALPPAPPCLSSPDRESRRSLHHNHLTIIDQCCNRVRVSAVETKLPSPEVEANRSSGEYSEHAVLVPLDDVDSADEGEAATVSSTGSTDWSMTTMPMSACTHPQATAVMHGYTSNLQQCWCTL